MNFILSKLIIFATVLNLAQAPADNLSEPKIPKRECLFEGDIIGIQINKTKITSRLRTGNRKITITKDVNLWPNGEVPYFIDPYANYCNTQFESQTIYEALSHIEDKANIYGKPVVRFIELKSTNDAVTKGYESYIKVIRGDGCFSFIGRQSNVMFQYLSLGKNCFTIGIIAHQFMHALGFYHENSRPDRDDYVTINYTNIETGMRMNFEKHSWFVFDSEEYPYDYESVMHYESNAFSKNGQDTIIAKKPGIRIGPRDGLSNQDAAKIIDVYGSFHFFFVYIFGIFVIIYSVIGIMVQKGCLCH